MSQDDLERRLRTEIGPREHGYEQVPLPATLEPQGAGGSSGLRRVAVLVPAAAAGIVTVAVASIMLASGPGPGTGTGVPSPPEDPGPSAARPEACTPEEVALTAEPWGAAAGSRGTVVTVMYRGSRHQCELESGIGAQVVDASGNVVVLREPRPQEPTVDLWGARAALLGWDGGYTLGVVWSNWCDDRPAEPVRLMLLVPGWDAPAEVSIGSGGADPVPPCLGEGQPSQLSVTDPQRSE
jgi:hypothetical protein